ncbi:ATP-binding protein [Phormidium sp. CCY1219]|uniref:ATP-binding protein n=1 Tax=Phormidium sp. CCY1219 TaxID=2886104 RepID=UPI002D1F74A6|nr:ATP-binding protein [Phormidium sp. CCY1219]MEB3826711.1 ATPase [Phormidium sp. CCY1219]
MVALVTQLWSGPFIPHGHCYLWKPELVGLHLLSDSLIAFAYFLIPLELVYLVKKRGDLPFDWLFFLFGSFIIFCGITHAMEVWTLWHPTYWLSGFLKAITAAVSLCTAAVLLTLVPKILAIPSPEQLKSANAALQNEIRDRIQAQEKLSKLTQELEQRVAERTASLADANERLKQENHQRSEAQEALGRSQTELRDRAEELETTLHQLRHTQTQLIQSEKMSSLGQLVAGIAHEINNPINFIHGNIAPAFDYIRDLLNIIDLYQLHYPNPPAEIAEEIEIIDLDFLAKDLQKILQSMKSGADRIRNIVRSLRVFSRLDEAEKKVVDIHENLDSTLLMLDYRLHSQPHRPSIQVIKDYGNLPQVECYPGQLNQVFINLLNNAIDAVESSVTGHSSSVTGSNNQGQMTNNQGQTPNNQPQITNDQGQITNDQGQITNDQGQMTNDQGQITNDQGQMTIHIRTRVTDDKALQICIADNGIGISDKLQDKIYEPFYTTKPVGKGTGLGLAIAYQIIEKHRGTLHCNSQAGKGTEFTIEIPPNVPELPPEMFDRPGEFATASVASSEQA